MTSETDKVAEFRKELLVLYLKESSTVGRAAGEAEGVAGEQIHAFWFKGIWRC